MMELEKKQPVLLLWLLFGFGNVVVFIAMHILESNRTQQNQYYFPFIVEGTGGISST